MKLRFKPLKDTRKEASTFQRRAIAGFLIIVACLAVLGTRFYYLQVERHSEFSAKSDANRIYTQPLAPARGLIYDRNGVLLADNRAAFRLEVKPEHVKDIKKLLGELREVVALNDEDVDRFNALRRAQRPFQGVPLRMKLSEEEIARFAVNRWRFPDADIVPYQTRYYPFGPEFAHLVGYVSRIDADEAEQLDQGRYAATTHIGKTGIERFYEDRLHGEPGYQQVEVNADRRPLRELERVDAKSGASLFLTIDARIQHAAQDAFQGRAGAAVAVDPRTGEVLAMVSTPSFDPNLFVNGISRIDYASLIEAEDKPLLNRDLRGNFTPGSTMKPYMALAGLEFGIRKPSDTVFSTGEFFIPGQSRGYRDDKKGGHGRVDLEGAIAQSVNTYFYSLALDMGIERLTDYMSRLGFGKPTGIDLVGEGSGVLPSKEWKRGRFNQPWYPGETVIAGIGQGYWVVTPLQLAQAASIVGNRGVLNPFHLLRATQAGIEEQPHIEPLAAPHPSIIRNPADYEAVLQGMISVINKPSGTAHGMGDGFPYVIAGKTGTAERFSRTSEAWENIMQVAVDRHQVLFECFTPADAPRIAVVVALEAGHTGAHDAAPIARKILDAWLASDESRLIGGPP